MADKPILTEAESGRILWAADFLNMDSGKLTIMVCQVKSFFKSHPSLLSAATSCFGDDWHSDGKALRALLVAIEGAMGGALIYFASGAGEALASALATLLGITVTAGALAVLVFAVGAILLFASLSSLIPALLSLAHFNTVTH